MGARIGEGAYSKVYHAQDLRALHRPNSQTASTTDNEPDNPDNDDESNSDDTKTRASDRSASATNLQTIVACKIFDCRRSSNDYVNKFLPRELRISGRVEHANIVRAQRVFEIGPFICCLMELCPCGDLLQCVQLCGPRPLRQARLWFGQLVDAVGYLHARGISHRDIKCENVLLCSDSHCKLTDFGFARALRWAGKSATELQLSETFCGSVAYAAPEVLCGRPYDPRAYDMWSLGCVLFIMVTGTMPFTDESVAIALRAQQQRLLYWPTTAPVSAALRATIVGMLEPVVERRTTMDGLRMDEWMMTTAPF